MANLPETATWDAGVYQIETTDPVLGGPTGVTNAPLKNLANRTAYLKEAVEMLGTQKAPIASPAFTGAPTAPTAAPGTNTTQLSTTAFVLTAVAAAVASLVTSVAGRTGAVVLTVADVAGAAPLASPAFSGAPTAPTASPGTSNTQLANTAFVAAIVAATKEAMYPVGSIYTNAAVTTNPATLLGFGTWAEFAAGRVLVGQSVGDPIFDTLQETGGSKDASLVSHTHTGTATSAGAHTHGLPQGSSVGGNATAVAGVFVSGFDTQTASAGAHSHTLSIDSMGTSASNANLQPYVVVKMWVRTA